MYERERQRDTERQTEIEGERQRQTDRQTETEGERQRERQRQRGERVCYFSRGRINFYT